MPEVLADQVGQPLPGDDPHAHAHLLHHDEGDEDRDDHPQQVVAEVRPGDGVGGDAARVVVDVRGDDARADDRQQEEQLVAGDTAPEQLPSAREASAGRRRRERGTGRVGRSTRPLLVLSLGKYSFHSGGRSTSRASSTVMMPTSWPSSSTGSGKQVVAGHQAGRVHDVVVDVGDAPG